MKEYTYMGMIIKPKSNGPGVLIYTGYGQMFGAATSPESAEAMIDQDKLLRERK